MLIEELLKLVSAASSGYDSLQRATVGFYGYGFFFADPFKSVEPFITVNESSKFADFGSYRGVTEQLLSLEQIKTLDDLGPNDDKEDFLIAGALKTLAPTLELGGHEILFWIWVFVKTREGKFLPITLYYGPPGTSLGGWHFEDYKVFPKDFSDLINASPFDFSIGEREDLIEALESALRKVPISDFYGVYQHDGGNTLMGVQSGIPFAIDLDDNYDEIDIEIWLDAVEYYKGKKV